MISNRLAIDGEALASANPGSPRPPPAGIRAREHRGPRRPQRGPTAVSTWPSGTVSRAGAAPRWPGRGEGVWKGRPSQRPQAARPNQRLRIVRRRAGALSGTMRFAGGRPRCGAARRDCAGASGPQKFRWIFYSTASRRARGADTNRPDGSASRCRRSGSCRGHLRVVPSRGYSARLLRHLSRERYEVVTRMQWPSSFKEM